MGSHQQGRSDPQRLRRGWAPESQSLTGGGLGGMKKQKYRPPFIVIMFMDALQSRNHDFRGPLLSQAP